MNAFDQFLLNHDTARRVFFIVPLILIALVLFGIGVWMAQGVWVTNGPGGFFPDSFMFVSGEMLATLFMVCAGWMAGMTFASRRAF